MSAANIYIAKNTFFIFFSKIIDFASGIMVIILVSHYLTPGKLGQYFLIKAITILLIPFISFGTGKILVREISVKKDMSCDFMVSGLFLNFFMAFFFTLCTSVSIYYIFPSVKIFLNLIWLGIVSETFFTMMTTISTVFIAYEKMYYNLITNAIARLLTILLCIAAIIGDLGLKGLFAGFALANAMGFFAAMLFVNTKFHKIRFQFNLRGLKYIMGESLPIIIASSLGQGYQQINVFLLKLYQSFVEVSFFQAPQRVLSPLTIFPISFLMAFAPSFSRLGNQKETFDELLYSCKRILKYIMITAVPFCVFVTVKAHSFVLLLFGKDLLPAVSSLKILIWMIIPMFANALFNFVLISIKKQKIIAYANAVCLVLNIIFGCILIPDYGHIGASVGMLISSIGLFSVSYTMLIRCVGKINIIGLAYKPALAGCICLFLLSKLAASWNVVFTGTVCAVIYLTVLFLLAAFNKEEIEFFKNVVFKSIKTILLVTKLKKIVSL